MRIDLEPLRTSREFRLLVAGESVSLLGSGITAVAIPIQVYTLTGSTVAVGAVGAAQFAGLLAGVPVGGILSDSLDRRRLLLAVNAVMAVVSLLLAANSRTDRPALWALYALAAATAALAAVETPARRSAVPRLIAAHHLVAAQPVEFLAFDVSGIVAPLIAGACIAGRPGATGAFLLDAVSFAVALLAIARMRPIPALPADPRARRSAMRSMRDGFHVVRTTPAIQGVFLTDTCATFFGMPTALFPALGVALGSDALGVSVLYAALPAGSLIATLSSGWTSTVRREGRVICIAAGAWGAAIAAAAATSWFPGVVILLAAAAAADTVSGIFRVAIVLRETPDALRGRLSAMEWAQVNAGPALGDLEAGGVARLTGIRFSMASGGLLCIAGVAAVAVALPRFWQYTSRATTTAPGGAARDSG